ncbi:MAG: rSAM-modified peptide [bacterium]|nr:rSAM-modified peptide [bacterium]
MKPKRFRKKLNLNKKTVVNLDDQDMGRLKGGISARILTNCTCDGNTCPCYHSEVYCPEGSQLHGYCDTLSLCI